MPASVMPVMASPIVKLAVSTNGGPPVEKGVKDAIGMLELGDQGRAWQGGAEELQIRSGLPGTVAVSAHTLSAQALVGGGQWGWPAPPSCARLGSRL
eukprot:5874965-Prymnesium_polylepis.1